MIQYVIGSPRLGNAGILSEKPKDAGRLWAGVLISIIALSAVFYFLWDYRDYVLLFGTIGVFWWLMGKARDSLERKRIAASSRFLYSPYCSGVVSNRQDRASTCLGRPFHAQFHFRPGFSVELLPVR